MRGWREGLFEETTSRRGTDELRRYYTGRKCSTTRVSTSAKAGRFFGGAGYMTVWQLTTGDINPLRNLTQFYSTADRLTQLTFHPPDHKRRNTFSSTWNPQLTWDSRMPIFLTDSTTGPWPTPETLMSLGLMETSFTQRATKSCIHLGPGGTTSFLSMLFAGILLPEEITPRSKVAISFIFTHHQILHTFHVYPVFFFCHFFLCYR